MLSFFLCVFIAMIGLFLLCAIIADLSKGNPADDYKVPKGWKSQIYDTDAKEEMSPTAEPGDRKAEETNPQDPVKPSSTAWYAILVVSYILLLFALSQYWEYLEQRFRKDGPPQQDSANPDNYAEAGGNELWR